MFVYISLLLLIIVSKQQCQSADVGNGAILVSTNIMDLMVYVDVEDHGISQTIREKGGHNRQLVDLLCKFVRNEESVVHVGAHIGLQTLAIGKYIKNKNFTNSFVHSFEPNQLNYILLVKSVYINDLQDIIHVYKTSISNEQGQSQIAIRNSDTSLAEIVFNSATKRKADYKYSVTTTTVDNVLKVQINQGIKFGLFYISCNTFEIQALMGMRTILAANRQAGIFVHWLFGKNPHKNVDGLIVTLKQLQQALYQLFVVDQNPIGSGEIRYRFRKLDNFMDIIKINEANLLFVPPSKIKNIEG